MKTIKSQRSHLGSYWTFLVFKAWWKTLANPLWLTQPSEHHSKRTMISWWRPLPKHHSRLTGSGISCHRNQTRDFLARYTVEYDCALNQQCISDKIVSLILCVWKPGFLKFSHIYCIYRSSDRSYRLLQGYHISIHGYNNHITGQPLTVTDFRKHCQCRYTSTWTLCRNNITNTGKRCIELSINTLLSSIPNSKPLINFDHTVNYYNVHQPSLTAHSSQQVTLMFITMLDHPLVTGTFHLKNSYVTNYNVITWNLCGKETQN